MDVATVKRDLYRGSFAAVLRVVLAVPVYLVLTPFTLKYLKQDQFAIWSFNATIIGLINLTDLGFKSSLLFHCAQAPDDVQRIRKLFGAALSLYVGLWILTVAACWLLRTQILDFLGVPVELHEPAGFVVMVTAIGFGLRFVATPFQAVIEAHYGVGYSQYVMLGWLVANAAMILLALPLHPGLYAMGWISLAGNALVLFAFYRHVRHKLPFLGWRAMSLDTGAMRSLGAYGAGIYAATVLITLREPLYKVFLSRSFGLEEVADFEIAFRLCTQIVSAVISPLLGIFAAAAVLSQRPADLATVLRPLCGITLLVLAPLALFLISFSGALVPEWLGASGAAVAALLPWMFAAFAVYYATEILYQAILGNGWSNYAALVQGICIASMAVVLLLAQGHGPVLSVGLSLLAGCAAFSLVNLLGFRQHFAGMVLFGRRPLLLFASPSLVYGGIVAIFHGQWPLLAVLFAVYLAIHLVAAKRLGIADPIAAMRRLVPRAA